MDNAEQIKLHDYIDSIRALPEGSLTKSDLLVPEFRLYTQGNLDIYYAPFEFVNTRAKVMFVGITPGFTQMEISYRVVRDALLQGKPPQEVLQRVKQQASFAGSMRTNLVSMLDGIGLATLLGIATTESLFTENTHLLHSTSVLRYPVFVDGENYTGHKPSLRRTSVFRKYINTYFRSEVLRLQGALFVPMGKAVSETLQEFVAQGILDQRQCLFGFPHPSGANGHRKRQYISKRTEFENKVMDWFKSTSQ